jgi:hypothetical protein
MPYFLTDWKKLKPTAFLGTLIKLPYIRYIFYYKIKNYSEKKIRLHHSNLEAWNTYNKVDQ